MTSGHHFSCVLKVWTYQQRSQNNAIWWMIRSAHACLHKLAVTRVVKLVQLCLMRGAYPRLAFKTSPRNLAPNQNGRNHNLFCRAISAILFCRMTRFPLRPTCRDLNGAKAWAKVWPMANHRHCFCHFALPNCPLPVQRDIRQKPSL